MQTENTILGYAVLENDESDELFSAGLADGYYGLPAEIDSADYLAGYAEGAADRAREFSSIR